ncbi:LOW QUALITY PROTEIN: hypothetical protein OSB04_013894 [Centaurea solstitialis]|uniref:Uncharacterized protein n=1 Tax=Centaurea solstitialis TaxID=347529 RepID=A0AA38WNT2_9ASTR|nr:LOW QUALITY PROTEIN: hypothetical protein OSB04_013894 [Centaurea solstitialis]
MDSGSINLHVVFLPCLAPGHTIPLVQLARLFAGRGVRSTIVTTFHNSLTFQPSIDQDIAAGIPLQVRLVTFPSSEVGLPPGVEHFGDAATKEAESAVMRGTLLLQPRMEQSIRDLSPDCIFSDMFHPWTVDLADELKIPRLYFHPSNFLHQSVVHTLRVYAPQNEAKSESESFVVPGLPDKITMKRSEIAEHLKVKTMSKWGEILKEVELSEKRSYGLVHNTFYEIEPAYVEHCKTFKGTKIWAIGPLFQFFKNNDDAATGVVPAKHDCLSWLDSQKPESVIYACFGSTVRFPDAQITEIALALEECKRPFVWVVRRKDGEVVIRGMPEGFQERIEKENKGLILTEWAPQVEILQHPAIGGFLTHCGWNSVLEAMVAGVPLIRWPLYFDQFYNDKLVELLGIGVGVGADVFNSSVTVTSPIIKKERIIDAIRALTGESSITESIRSKSKVISKLAKQAVEPGGSSFNGLMTLIEELKAIKVGSKSLQLIHNTSTGDRPAAAMDSGDINLHVVFLPFFAPGHMIPLVQLARLFAGRGVRSTIVTTVHNALTFKAAVDRDIAAGHPVNVHTLTFPASEVGLPVGVENVGKAADAEAQSAVIRGLTLLQPRMEQAIRGLAPDCIFSDMFSRGLLSSRTSSTFPGSTSTRPVSLTDPSLKVYGPQFEAKSESESFVVPGLPDEITMKRSEVPEHLKVKTKTKRGEQMERIEQAAKRSYGIVNHTFYEIEPAYVEHNKTFRGTKVWPIGPLYRFFENDDDDVVPEKHDCLSWLDGQKPNSVIYACFGSMVRFPDAQITEIALALEESGRPFVWVVRKRDGEKEIGGMPEGFRERIEKENKGLVLTEWAPQVAILNHPAIGGFLTHCGWNSVLEAMVAGVPLIRWPLYYDLFYTDKLVELLGIGVGVGADVWNPNIVITSPVIEKERIIEAIRILTGESAIAESIRNKAKAISVMAKQAIEPGGSSFNGLTTLIEELKAIKLGSKLLPY